jgi:hypothetical protein
MPRSEPNNVSNANYDGEYNTNANQQQQDTHQNNLDDHEKDILILELQDDLYRSEKDKNDI